MSGLNFAAKKLTTQGRQFTILYGNVSQSLIDQTPDNHVFLVVRADDTVGCYTVQTNTIATGYLWNTYQKVIVLDEDFFGSRELCQDTIDRFKIVVEELSKLLGTKIPILESEQTQEQSEQTQTHQSSKVETEKIQKTADVGYDELVTELKQFNKAKLMSREERDKLISSRSSKDVHQVQLSSRN